MNAHNIPELMQALGQHAKTASAAMAKASAAHKSAALRHLAALLRSETTALVAANQEDLSREPQRVPMTLATGAGRTGEARPTARWAYVFFLLTALSWKEPCPVGERGVL
jgi:hypothetical protein